MTHTGDPLARSWSPASLAMPYYDALIRRPTRVGRLRLAGLPPLEHQIARVALVVLLGLLGSLLLADTWRGGDLIVLRGDADGVVLLPRPLLAATLLALAVGWLAAMWGASQAAVGVRIAAALAFLALNAPLGRPVVAEISSSLAVRWGPDLARAAYAIVPVLVLLAPVFMGRARTEWCRLVLVVVVGAALLTFFGTQLWVYEVQVRQIPSPSLPLFLNGVITNLSYISVPLVLAAALGLVDFSYSLADAATVTVGQASARLARLLLAALLAVKLWVVFGRHAGEWWTYVRYFPLATVRVVASLAGILLAAYLFRRLGETSASEVEMELVKERVFDGSTLIFAAPVLTLLVAFGFVNAVFTQFEWLRAGRAADTIRRISDDVVDPTRALVWVVVLAAGLVLLRSRRPLYRETALALLIVGAWNLPHFSLAWAGRDPGFNERLLDVALTAVIAVFAVARWRRLPPSQAVGLAGVVIFSWLITTRGDFLEIVGRFLAVPAALVVVAGIVWTLLTGSEITAEDSPRLPRASRALIFVGYLVISAVILNWLEVTRRADITSDTSRLGFLALGIPFALWLALRRPWHKPSAPRTPAPLDQ